MAIVPFNWDFKLFQLWIYPANPEDKISSISFFYSFFRPASSDKSVDCITLDSDSEDEIPAPASKRPRMTAILDEEDSSSTRFDFVKMARFVNKKCFKVFIEFNCLTKLFVTKTD